MQHHSHAGWPWPCCDSAADECDRLEEAQRAKHRKIYELEEACVIDDRVARWAAACCSEGLKIWKARKKKRERHL